MNEDNESLFNDLKTYFDKFVDTNASLDMLGIDVNRFKDEARDIIMSKVQDMAAERLENNTE